MTEDHVVYRVYATDGSLLYVGCTSELRRRLKSHRYVAPWWPEVARIEVDGPYERREAMRAERMKIADLAPLHNKTGNRRRGWNHRRGDRAGGMAYDPSKDEFRQEAA